MPARKRPLVPISAWPLAKPRGWKSLVDAPQSEQEEAAIRQALKHSRPLGEEHWVAKMEKTLKLSPLRPRGRPKKEQDGT